MWSPTSKTQMTAVAELVSTPTSPGFYKALIAEAQGDAARWPRDWPEAARGARGGAPAGPAEQGSANRAQIRARPSTSPRRRGDALTRPSTTGCSSARRPPGLRPGQRGPGRGSPRARTVPASPPHGTGRTAPPSVRDPLSGKTLTPTQGKPQLARAPSLPMHPTARNQGPNRDPIRGSPARWPAPRDGSVGTHSPRGSARPRGCRRSWPKLLTLVVDWLEGPGRPRCWAPRGAAFVGTGQRPRRARGPDLGSFIATPRLAQRPPHTNRRTPFLRRRTPRRGGCAAPESGVVTPEKRAPLGRGN